MSGFPRRAALALLASPALAQDYPSRPIRVIVPSTPGGPPDLVLRALTPRLSAALGQPVILENRAGGGGLVAPPISPASRPMGSPGSSPPPATPISRPSTTL